MIIMIEPAERLAPEQRDFLTTVFQLYQRGDGWPILAQVEKVAPQGGGLLPIDNLLRDLTGYVRLLGSGETREHRVVLSPRALVLQNPQPPLADSFAYVVGFLAARQRGHQPKPGDLDAHIDWTEVADLLQRRWIPRTEDQARYLSSEIGTLLVGEGWLWRVFNGPNADGSWAATLGPETERFVGVKTAQEYLQRLDELLTDAAERDATWWKTFTEVVTADPASSVSDREVDSDNYDVALSFAGEQRWYVDQVSTALAARGVKHFYDQDKKIELWGKPQALEFQSVFRDKARFVVPFVSEDYARKAWPTHEFRSALEKAVQLKREYILPVRFDATDLPGLDTTIGYLEAADFTPEELADAIVDKLKSP
jgi:hypothetical protein